METLNSLTDHIGSLSARALEAAAHGPGMIMAGFGERNNASPEHAKLLLSDPSSLAISWSYPDGGFAFGVKDRQCPLGFEFDNILVRNNLLPKGIYNLQNLVLEHKFWFDPNCKGNDDQDKANQYFQDYLNWVGVRRHTVCREETRQTDCDTSPHEITSGTKSFRHPPSIAGDPQ